MRSTFALCALMMLSSAIAAPIDSSLKSSELVSLRSVASDLNTGVINSRDGPQNFRITGNPTADSEASSPKRALPRDGPQNFRIAGNPTPDSPESSVNPKRALVDKVSGGENFRKTGNPTPDSQSTPKRRELESPRKL